MHFTCKISKLLSHSHIGIGEKWPNLDISLLFLFDFQLFLFFYTKRFPFVGSLLVICFMMSMKNSNRCDEILVWEAGGHGNNRWGGKVMGIKPR